MNRVARVVTVAIAAAVAAVLLFPAFIALRADGNQIIEPQTMDYALLVIATLLIALGAQLAPWRAAAYVAFLGFLSAAALLFGILGAFGIGLAVLPLALVATLLLYRALRRRPLSAGRPAAIGGALAGYGAILMYIALIVPRPSSATRTAAAPRVVVGAEACSRSPPPVRSARMGSSPAVSKRQHRSPHTAASRDGSSNSSGRRGNSARRRLHWTPLSWLPDRSVRPSR